MPLRSSTRTRRRRQSGDGARTLVGLLFVVFVAWSSAACLAGRQPAGNQSVPKQPATAGEQSCIGLQQRICADVLAAASGWTPMDVAGYRIQCDAPSCNESGSLWANILWSDGSRTDQGFGWGGGWRAAALRDAFEPVPTPPVPATCINVPDAQCAKSWTGAMVGVGDDAQVANVVLVRIECTTTCTDALGEVRTTVGFRDGTTLLIGIASYGDWVVSPPP